MKNDFLAMAKIYSWLKSHFPSISQAKIYFFSLGKKFIQAKSILSRQMDGALWSLFRAKKTFFMMIAKSYLSLELLQYCWLNHSFPWQFLCRLIQLNCNPGLQSNQGRLLWSHELFVTMELHQSEWSSFFHLEENEKIFKIIFLTL